MAVIGHEATNVLDVALCLSVICQRSKLLLFHTLANMARGRFNKRGGEPRVDAVNEQEIELRNARLAELEEQRAQRRAEKEEDGEDEDEDDNETKPTEASESTRKDKNKPPEPTGPVTTEAEHRRNMAKLAQVRKRREEAEAKRKMEEEAEKQLAEEQSKLSAMALDDEDNLVKVGKSKSKAKTIPKLDKIAMKKMKPAQLKESLKERGLEIQGNAKVLLARLQKYEEER